MEQSKDYIFKHLHEKIRIQDIAEYLHLNANYLSELFRQCENVTLTDFILQEKVKLTRNLLAYSPYSYIEIATYLGFSSQSHLGKVFKKYTGMTLRQYREKYGQSFKWMLFARCASQFVGDLVRMRGVVARSTATEFGQNIPQNGMRRLWEWFFKHAINFRFFAYCTYFPYFSIQLSPESEGLRLLCFFLLKSGVFYNL